MKKNIFFLAIFFSFLCSCTSYIKVTRTVTKTQNVPYTINQVGDFTSREVIDANVIVRSLNDADAGFTRSKIEKVNIQSISVGALIGSGNTAQTLQLGATIQTSQLGSETLLNDSKVIQIQSSTAVDILSAVGNVTGLEKNITLHNALDLINTGGATKLSQAIQNNLSILNSNDNRIAITLNGKVPAKQRLVMNLTLQYTVTVTYSTCEETGIPFLGATEPCFR